MTSQVGLDGRRLGPVTVILGASAGVFPDCVSLLVDGGTEKAVIDPGTDAEALRRLARVVTRILNTHYHFDHIHGNRLFPNATVMLNQVEQECFPRLEAIADKLGIQEIYGDAGVAEWIQAVAAGTSPPAPFSPAFRPEWWSSTRVPAEAYPYGEFAIGSVRMVMVHSPGHTAGLACPFFPEEGLIYTADIDLTRFGPWYFGTDGDIDAFIRSSRALLALDAEWYLTGHEEGLLRRSEFAERLEGYLAIIDKRDRRILDLLGQGVSEERLTDHGVLYPTRYHVDPWVRMWDTLGTRKHVARLRARGLVGRR